MAGACKSFKPVQLRVVSVMSHPDWLKSVEDKRQAFRDGGTHDVLGAEAKLECFSTVEGWLKWYPDHRMDINATHRIELERVD